MSRTVTYTGDAASLVLRTRERDERETERESKGERCDGRAQNVFEANNLVSSTF